MKKILTLLMLSGILLAGNYPKFDPSNYKNETLENERMCKLCQAKVKAYKESMRDDEYAKKTLETYKMRLKKYCNLEK